MKEPEDELESADPDTAEGEVTSQERGVVAVTSAPGADGEAGSGPKTGELEALRRERDALKEQLLRRRADFENFRRRSEREREQVSQNAVAAVLRSWIPTLDNLERALQAPGPDGPLRQGVELTLRELLAALEANGVVVQDPTGQKFDPESQQALSHEVVPGFVEGTVVEVFRKGYLYKDQLLRPALVKVAKAKASSAKSDSEAVH